MPARDGTGPYGTGPVGRGLGPCGGIDQEPIYGQPYGMGMAYRRGRRFSNWQPGWGWRAMPAVDEKQALQARQSWLKEQLDAITRRIEELNTPSE